MVFSSVTFLLYFLPILLVLYFTLPFKNAILFLSSIFFYAWGEVHFAALLLVSILFNYIFGILIDFFRGRKQKTICLLLGVTINLSMIGFFKYGNFFMDNINELLNWMGLAVIQHEKIHLPLGISFFTFQAISYLVDVYRGTSQVVKKPMDLGLYISMFPQLVAGPIVRFNHIAKQLRSRVIGINGFSVGIKRFISGLAQKMLIANVVAVPADAIFALPSEHLTFGLVWLGVISYTLQIYFDFAGYSNMAIGLGVMFGFKFPENFNYPYISKSVTEFWRRWHMSLSAWFRDYLYIPLGGNRKGTARTYINLLVVFFLCGLWHGASWTFIFWGLFHGSFLVLERFGLERWLKKQWVFFRHLYVLLVVALGWVFFRSESFNQAVDMIFAMFGFFDGNGVIYNVRQYLTMDLLVLLPIGLLFSTPVLPFLNRFTTSYMGIDNSTHQSVQQVCMHLLTLLSFLFVLFWTAYNLAAKTHNPFIYFRF